MHQHWLERQKWLPLCDSSQQGWKWSAPFLQWLKAPFFKPLENFLEQSQSAVLVSAQTCWHRGTCLSRRLFTSHRGVCTTGALSVSQLCCLHLPQLKRYSLFRESKLNTNFSQCQWTEFLLIASIFNNSSWDCLIQARILAKYMWNLFNQIIHGQFSS